MSQDLQAHDGPAACENCATPLQGQFCYRCGQSSHNPLHSTAHAIEEVFESFWHLDGRIFRTLRALWSPGQLANSYLSGHRAPYVAPLRLFVVLSVITFFLAQFAVSFSGDDTEPGQDGTAISVKKNAFRDADTAAEVIEQRDEGIRGMLQGQQAMGNFPGSTVGFERGIASMREQARQRIRELDPKHPELQLPIEKTGPQPGDVAANSEPPVEKNAARRAELAAQDSAPPSTAEKTNQDTTTEKKPVDEKAAVAKADHADKAEEAKTGFMERWLDRKSDRLEENLRRYEEEPDLLKHAIMGSIPTALFFLVPIFAIFLKLAYLETGRSYLEHLVVGLYSHAWLCLALLVMCGLVGLDRWITPHADWFGVVIGILEFFLWWAMPIYLLLMQKRVYRQAWWLTVLKYWVIGTIYLVLVTFAAAFVGINSLISG